MCRIFAYNGILSGPDFSELVAKFSNLSTEGVVPLGVPSGHIDGWGIQASISNKDLYFRSVLPPQNNDILNSIKTILDGHGQVIVHLRKATVGKNMLCNTHPFLRSGIGFCHNGSIKNFSESNILEDRKLREGHTDSETFFIKVLSRVAGQIGDVSLESLKTALAEEISEIRKSNEWTSLTCLLKTSNGLILNYLWNENHPDSKNMDFEKYYTFFVGKKGSSIILCSEKLDVDGFVWEKMRNDTVFVLPV